MSEHLTQKEKHKINSRKNRLIFLLFSIRNEIEECAIMSALHSTENRML